MYIAIVLVTAVVVLLVSEPGEGIGRGVKML